MKSDRRRAWGCVPLLLLFGALLFSCQREAVEGDAERPRSATKQVVADGDAPQMDEVPPRYGAFPVGEAFVATSRRGVAGGARDVSRFGGACEGFADLRPGHAVEVKADKALGITIEAPDEYATSAFGLVLFAQDRETVVDCHFPFSTAQRRWHTELSVGRYYLLVTSDREGARVPYELALESIHEDHADAAESESTLPPLDRGGPPSEPIEDGTFGGVRFLKGDARARMQGRAGGTREAVTFGAECVGWIAEVPDHVLMLEEDQRLWIRVDSDADTTLAIRSPGERWHCNDDADGFNPALHRRFEPGRHEIYVGTWERGQDPPYVLRIGRERPQR